MTLDLLADFNATPDDGAVVDGELAVTDDVLVKAFALGPGGTITPHEHDGATNVFHVLRGTVRVERDGESETVSAPGVVLNERGQVHGAHNETDETAVLTASLCPLPGQ
jgi:quercetin dioxygenase-like cupin family protein